MFESSLFYITSIILTYLIRFVISEYNLIDTNPSCFGKGLCTAYGAPGSANSIHPNSEERTQITFRNIARLYPDIYINSKYGKHRYGTNGEQTQYFSQQEFCGVATARPLYWHSDGNQLARFHEWDAANCDDKDIGHSTCPKSCDLFNNDCSFTARSNMFVGDDGAVVASQQSRMFAGSEGLWGANMGYEDGHCGAVFDPKHTYHGLGFWPLRNGVTAVYITGGPDINYPLVQGTHFDERIKINSADLATNNEHLVFMVEYYGGGIENKKVNEVYVLYDGNHHLMNLTFGDSLSGFFEIHFTIPAVCKPYAFFVVAEDNEIYRLPQDKNYFFGTSWTEWNWWSPQNDCKENHYYYNGNKWIVNGSDKVSNNDACIGCADIDDLVTSFNNFGNSNDDPTSKPTTKPTVEPAPTAKPTDKPTAPTAKPTDQPTTKPTAKPTDKPTAKPTDQPTTKPTDKPTTKPTDKPTDKLTAKPTDKPTNKPTAKPTDESTSNPTNAPTDRPTDKPTDKPTTKPVEDPTTKSPTKKPTEKSSAEAIPNPTPKPTTKPTAKPTNKPTNKPTKKPTNIKPSLNPTSSPIDDSIISVKLSFIINTINDLSDTDIQHILSQNDDDELSALISAELNIPSKDIKISDISIINNGLKINSIHYLSKDECGRKQNPQKYLKNLYKKNKKGINNIFEEYFSLQNNPFIVQLIIDDSSSKRNKKNSKQKQGWYNNKKQKKNH